MDSDFAMRLLIDTLIAALKMSAPVLLSTLVIVDRPDFRRHS
ncbi:hypothetical protein [Stenotrophomonas pavanii]